MRSRRWFASAASAGVLVGYDQIALLLRRIHPERSQAELQIGDQPLVFSLLCVLIFDPQDIGRVNGDEDRALGNRRFPRGSNLKCFTALVTKTVLRSMPASAIA
jgi:hypothetical protein